MLSTIFRFSEFTHCLAESKMRSSGERDMANSSWIEYSSPISKDELSEQKTKRPIEVQATFAGQKKELNPI